MTTTYRSSPAPGLTRGAGLARIAGLFAAAIVVTGAAAQEASTTAPAAASNAAPAPAPAPAGIAATPPAPIGFGSVAEALKALEARDGSSATVTHPDGWVIVNDPAAAAQWSFTPAGHYAYPAVVRRVIKRSPGGDVSVETSSLCETDRAACDKLIAEFKQLDERISQSIKSRSRPTRPAQ